MVDRCPVCGCKIVTERYFRGEMLCWFCIKWVWRYLKEAMKVREAGIV